MGIAHLCENAHFTYKILQYTSFNCTCYTCSYDKCVWDISQYNKLSDIQYARFQILPLELHVGLFWSAGIPTMIIYCLNEITRKTWLQCGSMFITFCQQWHRLFIMPYRSTGRSYYHIVKDVLWLNSAVKQFSVHYYAITSYEMWLFESDFLSHIKLITSLNSNIPMLVVHLNSYYNGL